MNEWMNEWTTECRKQQMIDSIEHNQICKKKKKST